MKINNMLSKYRASFIPTLSVLTAVLIFLALGKIFGKIEIEKVEFETISGIPALIGQEELHDIVQAGLWWLLTTYLLWVVALISLLACFFVVYRSLRYHKDYLKRNLYYLMGLFVFLGMLLFLSNKFIAPIVSAQDLICHINLIADGSRNLVDLTQGITIIVILFVFITSGYVMIPEIDQKDIIRKVQLMNVTLYTGSAIILVWLLQSRMLYHYSATLLIQDHKDLVQSIAPTISLVVGALASICLFLMYISAIVWLQARHAMIEGGKYENKSVFDYLADEDSPARVLIKHFSRILAVILPLVPGTLEMFIGLG